MDGGFNQYQACEPNASEKTTAPGPRPKWQRHSYYFWISGNMNKKQFPSTTVYGFMQHVSEMIHKSWKCNYYNKYTDKGEHVLGTDRS